MIKPRFLRVALLAQLKGTLFEGWAAALIYREVDRLAAAIEAERLARAVDVKAKGSLAIPVLGAWQARRAAELARRQAEQQMLAWQTQAQMMSNQSLSASLAQYHQQLSPADLSRLTSMPTGY